VLQCFQVDAIVCGLTIQYTSFTAPKPAEYRMLFLFVTSANRVAIQPTAATARKRPAGFYGSGSVEADKNTVTGFMSTS
jgi:hypothetical protein